MNSGIYKITNPLGQVYIGQSSNLQLRLSGYQSLNSGTSKNQKRLSESFEKYGKLNHTIEIIEYCPADLLNKKERYWQDFYECIGSNGLNCKLTSEKNKRAVYSKESRERMSANRTGEKNHMFGRTGKNHPNFGKKQSEETKKKYSYRKGIKKSEQHKINIGIKQKGSDNHQAKLVIDLQTGIFYGSIIEAATAKGINKHTLYDNVNERRGRKNRTSIIFA